MAVYDQHLEMLPDYCAAMDRAVGQLVQSGVVQIIQGSRWLITGGTGWLGSVTVRLLFWLKKTAGVDVNIVVCARDRKKFSDVFSHNIKNAVEFQQYQAVQELKYLGPAPDFILHFAGQADPRSLADSPVDVMDANIIGAKYLLEYLRTREDGRILLVSSGEVYGEIPDYNGKISEEMNGYVDPVNPRSCYQNGKRASETLLASYVKQFGIDGTIARVAHAIGPGFSRNDSRVIPQFIRSASGGNPIRMYSAGNQIRSYTNEIDIASGLIFVATKGLPKEAYNIASSHSISIRQLAIMISDAAKVPLKFDYDDKRLTGCSGISRSELDNSKLKKIGWRDLFDYEETVECAVSCYRKMNPNG